MYGKGQGVKRDYEKAMKWYRLAAAQGYAVAQYNLGNVYRDGEGVGQDYAEAVKWFRLAAAQGLALAQYNLGFRYVNGQGVAKDNIRAHMWFNLSAISGVADAAANRDLIAKRMTPQQIAQAQEIARRCKSSNYKQCD